MKVQVSVLALAVGLVLGGVAAPLLAQDAPLKVTGVTNGPCMEGICEYQLKNGMKVLLFPDNSKPLTTVNIAYGVGSVHEGYGETGMAHLLEHLLFKDSAKYKDIPNEMKKRSIDFNATTSFDRTNYFASFPSSEERLNWVLGLEADRMKTSSLRKAELDSEMTVVRNEMERGENNSPGILHERLMSTAFLWHPYRRSTIGARSDVENVQIENLRDFYRRWYRPDNATLVVAGQFDPKSTLAKIEKEYGTIANPAGKLQPSYTVEPTQDGERAVLLQRQGDFKVGFVGYHTPSAMHDDMPELRMLSIIFNDTPSGRLYKALVEPKIAAQANLSLMSLKDPSLTTGIVVTDKNGDLGKANEILIDSLQNISKNPITQEELDLAKQKMSLYRERMTEDVASIGTSLTESIALGDWRMMFFSIDEALKVSLDDVNKVAQKYFKTSNRTVAQFLPTDNPDRAIVTAAPAASDRVKDYKGGQGMAAGEAFDPTPENVAKRTEIYKLSPKVTVNLLPKKTRGNSVLVNAQFKFADFDSMVGKPLGGAMVGQTLMLGSTNYTQAQIRDKLIALKSAAQVTGNMNRTYLVLNGKRDTVNEAVALLAGLLREPTVPTTELEAFRNQYLTSLEAQRSDPGSVAMDAAEKHFDPWPKGHPLAFETLDARIAKVRNATREELLAYHRDYYGMDDGVITVVGDFDVPSMKETLAKSFAGNASKNPYKRSHPIFKDVAPETVRIQIADKPNAVVVARSNVRIRDTDPEYLAMMVADDILGSGMDSRLSTRLRINEGLTYGVGTIFSAGDSPTNNEDDGYFMVMGTVASPNVDKYIASLKDELAKVVREGVTDAEVKKSVGRFMEKRRTQLSDDSDTANVLTNNANRSWTMADYAKRTAALSALTAADVNAAIRKLVRPDQMSVYVAGDLTNAAAK